MHARSSFNRSIFGESEHLQFQQESRRLPSDEQINAQQRFLRRARCDFRFERSRRTVPRNEKRGAKVLSGGEKRRLTLNTAGIILPNVSPSRSVVLTFSTGQLLSKSLPDLLLMLHTRLVSTNTELDIPLIIQELSASRRFVV